MLDLLHQCTRETQEVFLHALYTVTSTKKDRVANAFEKVTSFDKAQGLVLSYSARQPAAMRPVSNSLVWLQTLLLMILDCDGRGPNNLLGKDGIPKSTLIPAATKLGYDLAKILGQLRTRRHSDPDTDSEPNLTRRNWVSLIILTRWHALGVADGSLFETHEIGGLEDERVVGTATYQLGCKLRYYILYCVKQECADIILNSLLHISHRNGHDGDSRAQRLPNQHWIGAYGRS